MTAGRDCGSDEAFHGQAPNLLSLIDDVDESTGRAAFAAAVNAAKAPMRSPGSSTVPSMADERDNGPKLTHTQLVELALNHPDVRYAEPSPLVIERHRLYEEAARALLDELADAGFGVADDLTQLKQWGDYRAVVPILLDWLPRADYLMLSIDIVRALAVPFARAEAFPVLVAMFRNPPEVQDPLRPQESPPAREALRDTIGATLGTHVSPATASELIELVVDRSYGGSRGPIVAELHKAKDPRVADVLVDLLGDPKVDAFAVQALGKLKNPTHRDTITALLDHPSKEVRNQAKKALKRIDTTRH